jgi:hypothetical protein
MGEAVRTDITYIADDRFSFTATVPAVIQQLGYSSANAQLLTIPIYVFAMLMTIIFAFWSDKVQQRSPFIMAGYSIAAVGFIGQLAIPHTRLPGLTYGFLFPVAAGLYCPFVHIVSWTGKSPHPSNPPLPNPSLTLHQLIKPTTSPPPPSAQSAWASSSPSATWAASRARTSTSPAKPPNTL